jgi:cytosine/adenosine deaminase-related metal-dependent hydrolase
LRLLDKQGTDIVSNNSADMFTALRVGLQAVRAHVLATEGVMHSGVPIACDEVLKWDTIDAASMLGMETVVGSITPGKQADILLLGADTLTLTGWDRSNVASAIALRAQAADVDTVWVNGQIVKRDGKLLADTKTACTLMQATSSRLHERIAQTGGFALTAEETTQRMMAVAGSEQGWYDFSH